jgi:hypothetical protein
VRIVQLETTGVRGLRDGSWTFEPGPDRDLTVVTGPPQAGLTTFLDAIALTAARLAFGGVRPDAADALREGASTAVVRSTWRLDASERAFGGLIEETARAEVVFQRGGLGRADADPALLGLMSRYDHSPATGKVYTFPARRVDDSVSPLLGDFEADQRQKHLSPDASKFGGLSPALARLSAGAGDRARFEAAQRLFAELTGSATLAGISPAGHLTFALGSGLHVPLHRLSFGERNAFVLAATAALAGLDRSVVLFDTPEMGLAPGVAARWVETLRRNTPGAQWIVASRDPAVLSAAGRDAVLDLSGRAA